MRQEIKTMLVTCDGCRAQHAMTGVQGLSRFTPEGWREIDRCGCGMTDYCTTRLLCGDCVAKEAAA